MNRLTDIQNYVGQVLASHTDLNAVTNKYYYKLTENEASALQAKAHHLTIHADAYNGRFTGSTELLVKPVNLLLNFLVKSEGVGELQQEAAYITAETFMDDFITKLAHEQSVLGDCFPLYGLDFTSVAFDRIGPEDQYGFGYRLILPIKNNGIYYNPSKWL